MARRLTALAMIAAVTLPAPSLAQFSVLRDAMRGASKPKPAEEAGTETCKKSGKSSRGGAIMGNVLGGMASRTVGRTGIGSFIPMPEFATLLTSAFACKLEPKEQKQAADATITATRGGEVGSTAAWTSAARPGVTGSSTVAGKEKLADGTTCMSVRDVAIVDGEETTVSKRMCRRPGASGYTLQA